MMMHSTKLEIKKNIREQLVAVMTSRLADAIDLKLQAKQAHWNVKGPNFIALHELFDRVATEVDTHVDDLAERITTLGGTAMGTLGFVAKRSSMPSYPEEITDGVAHVDALSSALAFFGAKIREDIDVIEEIGDVDTADLFTGISRSIDKLVWFVESHNHGVA